MLSGVFVCHLSLTPDECGHRDNVILLRTVYLLSTSYVRLPYLFNRNLRITFVVPGFTTVIDVMM